MRTNIMHATKEIQELYQIALYVREKSYSPYSNHKVGAALLDSSGTVYKGCNIENASFGATTCAERVAIQSAISEKGNLSIKAIVVVTDATPPWPPCGLCRQVLSEFGIEFPVYLANIKGDFEKVLFEQLFPKTFGPYNLR